MTLFKKILDNYFESFLEEKLINILCIELNSEHNNHFYLELYSYPPIGSLINIDKLPKLFKIESLEIQNSRGAFCIARGVFVDKIKI